MNSQEYEWWDMQIQTMLTKAKYKKKKGGVRIKLVLLKLDFFELTHCGLITSIVSDPCYSLSNT